ncbi:sterol-sensing domain of SREBP cleavage-activation-domain-containing protein [Obelidium mucronatum]|nr:sterol-sensing domain of SREBP cleavage-activation-domain-containing protein [Obelidium mucronatum]
MAHQSTSTIMAIESLFYHHGVLCASYPLHVLTLSIVAIVVLSWPVVLSVAKTSLSSPNYEPIQFWDSPSKRSGFQESRFVERFGSTPHLRLEQIVFNASSKYLTSFGISGVLEKDVLLEALDLQTRIEASSINYHPSVGLYTDSASNPIHDSITLSIKDICFLASNGKCLVHSPLEFWKSNSQALRSDPDILRTLSNSSALSSFQTPIPLHSVFGGVILNHEHTSNSPPKIVGASSIVITYFLEERRIESILSAFSSASPVVDENLISRIFDNLWVLAVDKKNQIVPVEPLTDISHTASFGYWLAWRSDGDVKHLYYVFGEPEDVLSVEMVIVLLTYIIVFFYISLVLGKVELVKSKFGLGLGAVLMVFSSLTMSVGLTSWMGVTSSLVPWEVLPFLIIAIGVENIRVITNAVVTSAIDLPVKERVGIGLSKVGAKMAYSLARELCLLVLVSLINVPALQEFCLFATVAVVIDFMMQITFFTTILSIDIRRLELSDLPNLHGIKSRNQSANPETDRSRSTTYSSSSRWGAITMAIIMAAIGFGVYGTTSQPNSSIAAGPIESPLPIWENSVSVTADVLWEVINPTQIDQYVEIRPPIYVTLSNSQKESPTNPAETQSKQKPSIRKERWTITIDNYSFEIPRSVFIVVFVGLIVLICLGVIMLSSLIYYLAAGVSTPNLAQMKSKRNTLDDTQKIIPSAPVEFKNAQVISLVGSSILDVEFLDCSSDGTAVWSCRDGYVHIWNCRTSRKIVLRDGCETSESKNSGDGISAFRLSGQYLIIGTYLGVVRVWDTYHGKLLSVLFNKKHRSAIYDVIIVGGSDQYLCAVRFDGSLDGWSLPIKLLSSEEPFTSEQATFTAEYLKATPSCLSIEFETILAASNEGLVKLISPSKLSNSNKKPPRYDFFKPH